MEAEPIEPTKKSLPNALQRLVHHYYSSGFWSGFLTGVATGVAVSAAIVRSNKKYVK